MRQIALVGAGFISASHLAALQTLAATGRRVGRVAAVVDPSPSRAAALAAQAGRDVKTFDSVQALIAAGGIDAAHVLVPPNLHRRVAEPLLQAGIPVFLEKPMAASADDARALRDAARTAGAGLGINHNFQFHPHFHRMAQMVADGRIGPLRHIQGQFHMPLRQWDAGQVTHWMFQKPVNILLEQGIHPLSQIRALTDGPAALHATVLPPRHAPGAPPFFDRWLVSGHAGPVTVQLELAFGQAFPAWTIAVTGEDGRLEADMVYDRLVKSLPTQHMPQVDLFSANLAAARGIWSDAWAGILGYAGSMVRLSKKGEPFGQSMTESIAAFYKQLDSGDALPDGDEGVTLVAQCEALAAHAPAPAPDAAPAPAPSEPEPAEDAPAALVIGGSGFIGKAVVRALRQRGWRVRVLARSIDPDRPLFNDPGVTAVKGNAQSVEDVAAAAMGARTVINLTHGGGEASREGLLKVMVGSVDALADACRKAGVAHLIHAGTIASLYLGQPGATVTGATPVDPQADRRADYAWAKARAEQALWRHRDADLKITVLRPGIVLGPGTSPFHSGFGLFNRPTYCLGWNDGRNVLPLVLVDDVAEAFALAAAQPEAADGKTYNLAGDVALSARDFLRALAAATGRPIRFVPQSPSAQFVVETGKYAIKRVGGRQVPFPSLRDIKSRGMPSRLDCSDIKQDLGWAPESDRDRFLTTAIGS